jgi:hypothetical protein
MSLSFVDVNCQPIGDGGHDLFAEHSAKEVSKATGTRWIREVTSLLACCVSIREAFCTLS